MNNSPFFFNRNGRKLPMGMKVRTIRCEHDMDNAIDAVFSGEEFVPRFFSESFCNLYTRKIVQRVFEEEDERLKNEVISSVQNKFNNKNPL